MSDNHPETISSQGSLEPIAASENLQSNLEEIQLQRSTRHNTVDQNNLRPNDTKLSSKDYRDSQQFEKVGGPNLADFATVDLPEIQSELLQLSSIEQLSKADGSASDIQNSTAFTQTKTTELLSNIELNNQTTENHKAQTKFIQPSSLEQLTPERNEPSSTEHSTPTIQTKLTEAGFAQSLSLETQPIEGLSNATKTQNSENNPIQSKVESLFLNTHAKKSIKSQTPVSDAKTANPSEAVITDFETSISSSRQLDISGVADVLKAATIQPKLEAHASETSQGFEAESSEAALSLLQTSEQQQETEQTTESLSRSPLEQISESLDGSLNPSIQASSDNPQPTPTSESTQGKTAAGSANHPRLTNHLQTLPASETAHSKSSSSISYNEKEPFETARPPDAEAPVDGSLVQKQPDSSSSIEHSLTLFTNLLELHLQKIHKFKNKLHQRVEQGMLQPRMLLKVF